MLTKSDIEGLELLHTQTENFTSTVFDWVAPLKQHALLQHLYDFKAAIEAELETLNNQPQEAQDEI